LILLHDWIPDNHWLCLNPVKDGKNTLKQDQLVLEQLQLETVGVMIFRLGFCSFFLDPSPTALERSLGNGLRFGKKIPELTITCLVASFRPESAEERCV